MSDNDVQEDITLSSTNPPTFEGRELLWSGEDRVPEPGERVVYVADSNYMWNGNVVGYFQAHGYLGVKVLLTGTGEVVCVFGSEIDVGDLPERGEVN